MSVLQEPSSLHSLTTALLPYKLDVLTTYCRYTTTLISQGHQ